MTFKLTRYGQSRTPLAGVPWRDLSDDEMRDALDRYPGLADRGYFEREDEQPAPLPARGRQRGQAPAPVPEEEY